MDYRESKLFAGIREEDTDKLLTCLNAEEHTFKKGEIILMEGTQTEHVGVVISGKVMIELGDVWGNNSVLNSIGPGGIFAEAYACSPGEPLLVNVIAAEETKVMLLNVKKIFTMCKDTCYYHSGLVKNLLAICASKNLQLSRRMLHTTSKSIRGRLLSFFSECVKRQGDYSFDIPYNRQQLADYLNVERSALCSELSKMQKDGLINYEKNHFEVDKNAEV